MPSATLLSEMEEGENIEIAEADLTLADIIAMEEAIAYLIEAEDNALAVAIEPAEPQGAQTGSVSSNNNLPSFDACRQEELVGFTTCIMNEPELIEDPLIADNCADSASPWCDPHYEAVYLSYLEQQKQQKLQAEIFPNFIAPVDEGLVLRGMQSPKKRKRGHYGVDIIPRTWERKGTSLKAVEDGIVVKSSRTRGYGYYIVIYHQNGLFSLYSHTLKGKRAKLGQKVNQGDTIAYMGKSGNARGYHLHFELIDLREDWNFEESIDQFVQKISQGKALSACECGQFNQLLFAKSSKQDPLQSIPGLAFAKQVKGKWVAGEAIYPSTSNARVATVQ